MTPHSMSARGSVCLSLYGCGVVSEQGQQSGAAVPPTPASTVAHKLSEDPQALCTCVPAISIADVVCQSFPVVGGGWVGSQPAAACRPSQLSQLLRPHLTTPSLPADWSGRHRFLPCAPLAARASCCCRTRSSRRSPPPDTSKGPSSTTPAAATASSRSSSHHASRTAQQVGSPALSAFDGREGRVSEPVGRVSCRWPDRPPLVAD